MNVFYRAGAVSTAIMAAFSAHAVTFAFQTEGEYSETANTITASESAPTYRAGHDAGLTVTSVNYSLLEATPGLVGSASQIFVGSGTITGKYLGINYTLSFSVGTGGVFHSNNSTLKRSFAGDIVTFTISGSALDGYTGNGVFGGTFLGEQTIFSGLSKTSFDLDAEPVPEPASMAALGLGLAGIASRRKRK